MLVGFGRGPRGGRGAVACGAGAAAGVSCVHPMRADREATHTTTKEHRMEIDSFWTYLFL